jgi:transketolase
MTSTGLAERAQSLREKVFTQVSSLGNGYLSQGLQCADVFAVLFFEDLHDDDQFLLSNGHSAVVLYAALAEKGLIPEAELVQYGQEGSRLTLGNEPGHVPGVLLAGGSLGQGLGVATGWALGKRVQGHSGRVLNYMSDGELQEGASWEAALFAGHHGLAGLTNLVDVNSQQSDGPLVLGMGSISDKFRAFGWWAIDVDGNDITAVSAALAQSREISDRPKAVVLHTQPGKGSPTIENLWNPHYIRATADEFAAIRDEIEAFGKEQR